jgi:metal-responsive CopG/Arc/MetJ family transcriptional regulator
MSRKNYVNISIPSELVDLLDQSWSKSKKGYRSRAEFVMEAIREKIDKEKNFTKK